MREVNKNQHGKKKPMQTYTKPKRGTVLVKKKVQQQSIRQEAKTYAITYLYH